jgi:hypothetical protein
MMWEILEKRNLHGLDCLTDRMRLPGGWLYRTIISRNSDSSVSMVYVAASAAEMLEDYVFVANNPTTGTPVLNPTTLGRLK